MQREPPIHQATSNSPHQRLYSFRSLSEPQGFWVRTCPGGLSVHAQLRHSPTYQSPADLNRIPVYRSDTDTLRHDFLSSSICQTFLRRPPLARRIHASSLLYVLTLSLIHRPAIHSKPGEECAGEPLNVVISGQSHPYVLSDIGFFEYLRTLAL